MKIEKIKDFNQVILAIAGILGLILLLVFIIMLVPDLFGTWNVGSGRNTTISNSLIADEKMEKLNQENLRLQIISYESPELIDTLNSVYIIPVSVSTLNKPETVVEAADDGIMGLMDSYSSARKKGYYRENYFDGLYANLIIYQPVEDKTILLFNERIMLSKLRTYHFKDDILLVFFTAEKDSNKDGLVNFNDDTNLCIYSLKSGKMHRIAEGTNSIRDYQFIENSKDLLVEFSLSQYNDVKFKSYKPGKIMRYEFETEKLSEVVPARIQQQMQNLVEGKKTP
ncbi:MAG: hypothetical protein LBQ60_15610 [Bacteroidales bacterium]|jgi:hypothetical protein|nr:hypothetical protein [Bacteroidales bacterium]